jgi:CheY-like chemotaxis protein
MAHTVLVVEDDADMRELMNQFLHLEGFSATTARNGREALALLRSGVQPTVILLDLMMPVMDGWAFRREQQSDPEIAKIPVVVLSAAGIDRISEIDAAASFTKPVNFDRVLQTVRHLCANH